MSGKLLQRITLIALCLCVTGCSEVATNMLESSLDSILESETDIKERHENPALIIQKIEDDRREETLRIIEKQNLAEEAEKKKKFNEMFEKQRKALLAGEIEGADSGHSKQ